MNSNAYKTDAPLINGSSYGEINKNAKRYYKELCSKTKRKPYIRSAYFGGQKVFLEIFWSHLYNKNSFDQTRRLRYYACAIDLIAHSKCHPEIMKNPRDQSETFYRFTGTARDGKRFRVQVKESANKKGRYFISVFPDG